MPRRSGHGRIVSERAVRGRPGVVEQTFADDGPLFERLTPSPAGLREDAPRATAEELEMRRRALQGLEAPPRGRLP
jgi:hypothetical protein